MYEFLDYRVCDAMTVAAVSVGESTTLAQAEALFEKHDFNSLPVVAGKRLVGVVTKLDLLKAFRFNDETMFPAYEQIMSQPVSQVMTRDVVSVHPRTPLTRVLENLVDLRAKSLPVTVDGELVGIVAREDVLRALRRAVSGERATGSL